MLNFGWWRDKDNREGAKSIVDVLKVAVPALTLAGAAIWGVLYATDRPASQPQPTLSTTAQDCSPIIIGDGNAPKVVCGLPAAIHKALVEDHTAKIKAAYDAALGAHRREQDAERKRHKVEREALEKQLELYKAIARQLSNHQEISTHSGAGRASDQAKLLDQKIASAEAQLAELTMHYGKSHPSVARLLSELAGLKLRADEFGEAERLYLESLGIGTATLGPEHPDSTAQLNNLGTLLWRTGRYDAAADMLRRQYNIERQQLGPTAPRTLLGAHNFAKLLRAHFPDDPALKELEATFGPDIGK